MRDLREILTHRKPVSVDVVVTVQDVAATPGGYITFTADNLKPLHVWGNWETFETDLPVTSSSVTNASSNGGVSTLSVTYAGEMAVAIEGAPAMLTEEMLGLRKIGLDKVLEDPKRELFVTKDGVGQIIAAALKYKDDPAALLAALQDILGFTATENGTVATLSVTVALSVNGRPVDIEGFAGVEVL